MSAKQAGAASLGMASENLGYSRVRLRRVKKLQFGVVDPNELVSCCVVAGKWVFDEIDSSLLTLPFVILFVIALSMEFLIVHYCSSF